MKPEVLRKKTVNNESSKIFLAISAIVSHPTKCFIIALIILCSCAYWAVNITKNTTPYFLDRDHAERIKEDALTETFLRSKESIFVVIEHKSGDIFKESSITTLEKIHAALEDIHLIELIENETLKGQLSKVYSKPNDLKNAFIDEYNSQLKNTKNEHEKSILEAQVGQYLFPIRDIKSLLNSDDIFMEDDDISVLPNFGYDKVKQWRQGSGREVLDNKLFVGSIINKAGSAMSIQVELDIDTDNSKNTTALFHKVRDSILSIAPADFFDVYFSGAPVVNVEISNVMEKDNQRYFPMIIGLIAFILFAVFRSIWAPVLALSVSVTAIVITFGCMYLLNISLNIVTTILPIFIITIGVTDAIHVLSETSRSAEHKACKNKIDDLRQTNTTSPHGTRIVRGITKLFQPMLLTSLTTALGFFSLSYIEITNIKEFGVMVGLSTLIAFLVSVTVLPALMAMIKPRTETRTEPKYEQENTQRATWFDGIEKTAKSQTFTRALFLIVILSVFAGFGIPKFYVDQQNLKSFGEQTDIRKSDEKINALFGGTTPVNIWIKTEQDQGILDPLVLSAIEGLVETASKHAIVGYSASINDFIEKTNDVLFPENKNASASSLGTNLVAQYLLLLEGGPSRELESLTNVGSYNQTRIVLMVKTDSSKSIEALLADLETAASKLPSGATYTFAGYGAMNVAAADEIVLGQLSSITISVIGLLLITSLLYKSLTFGLIAIFPLFISLAVMFGLMGYLGIPLDIGSCLICGIAFGIGIDYSIHIIEAFKRHLATSSELNDAMKQAISDVAFPIVTSAITISLGFSILMISEFQPIYNLGLLVSITMLVSAVAALFVIPSFLKLASAPAK